jgi:hypothetical protein
MADGGPNHKIHLPLVACSLEAGDQQSRLAEWKQLLAQSTAREDTETGALYSFVATDELERRIRDLAAAEHACCSFLEFQVAREDDEVLMSVTAPAEAQDALRFIFRA